MIDLPPFLWTADLHLRPNRPRCRLDKDWMRTQELMLKEIAEIANRNKVPVLIGGDLFHRPSVPEEVLILFFKFCRLVKKGVYSMSGNHDLPEHSWENVDNSAFGIVNAAGAPDVWVGFSDWGKWNHWGQPEQGPETGIRFLHRLVFESKKDMPPNVNASTAQDLLDEFPDSKWIFTGDMHKAFHYEKGGRHVVNPGCAIRQAADFKGYQPRVYLFYPDSQIVESVPLEADWGNELVTDEYLREDEAREERIEAFVETVRSATEISLSFEDNVEAAILKNSKTLTEPVTKTIRELMEAEGE